MIIRILFITICLSAALGIVLQRKELQTLRQENQLLGSQAQAQQAQTRRIGELPEEKPVSTNKSEILRLRATVARLREKQPLPVNAPLLKEQLEEETKRANYLQGIKNYDKTTLARREMIQGLTWIMSALQKEMSRPLASLNELPHMVTTALSSELQSHLKDFVSTTEFNGEKPWELFELYPASLQKTGGSMVIREKIPRQDPSGTWRCFYGYFNGRVSELKSATGDFSEAEQIEFAKR